MAITHLTHRARLNFSCMFSFATEAPAGTGFYSVTVSHPGAVTPCPRPRCRTLRDLSPTEDVELRAALPSPRSSAEHESDTVAAPTRYVAPEVGTFSVSDTTHRPAGTLSSQPDYHKNFPAYARYISRSSFLASHLVASLLGTGIGLLGFTALFVYLATGNRPAIALAAFVMTILGNVGLVAIFGVAAFAQRAIGKAYLAGHLDVVGVNSSVYGTPLVVTSFVALALFFAGVILFAIAISGSESLPRLAGVLLPWRSRCSRSEVCSATCSLRSGLSWRLGAPAG